MLIRLLMDGSRTEQTAEEWAERTFVAPFILDDPDNAKRLLRYTAGTIVVDVFELGYWLFRSSFPDSTLRFAKDRRVTELMNEWLATDPESLWSS
jgi:hypothetical protein